MATPARPYAEGYGANVGDEWYRIAPNPQMPLNVYTRDSLAPRTDESDSEETVLDIGYAFSRSDLTGGEGLDRFPRRSVSARQPRDRSRYWDSSNFVMERPESGQPNLLEVAFIPEVWWNVGAAVTDMAAAAGQLYVISADTVYRFSDLGDTTPDDTDDINVTLIQVAAATDGAVAVLDTAGDIWYKAPVASAYLKVYDSAADGPMLDAKAIWLAKGRILAYCDDLATAGDGILLEISPVITGTPASPTEGAHTFTTIDTFPSVMLDCVDAGHAIVASFSDGSVRSYVPQTDTQGGTPDLTIRGRTPMPIGEVPYRLAYNAGTLLVFTLDGEQVVRLYSGLVLDDRFDYVVGQLQLIRTWSTTAETYPAYTANAVPTRDSIYFWMEESGSADWNLWRYDLVTTGLFRERSDSWDARPTGSVMFEGSVVFGQGNNIYRDSENYMEEAWLITPNIDFGINTTINFTAFVMEAFSVDSGTSVELYHSIDPAAILDPDHAAWTLVTILNDIAQSGIEHTRINISSTSLALKVVARSIGENQPLLTRFAMRALPAHRDWIAEIPINVSDWIEAPGRSVSYHPGLGDETLNRALLQQGQSTVLHLLNPDLTFTGIVHNLGLPITYTTDRGSQGRFLQMVFLGRLLTEEEEVAAIGTEGLGIGTLGLATLGIGEI